MRDRIIRILIAEVYIIICKVKLFYKFMNMSKDEVEVVKTLLNDFDINMVLEQLDDYGKYKGIMHCEEGNVENYIPVSVAKKIVKHMGLGGVLGYLEK